MAQKPNLVCQKLPFFTRILLCLDFTGFYRKQQTFCQNRYNLKTRRKAPHDFFGTTLWLCVEPPWPRCQPLCFDQATPVCFRQDAALFFTVCNCAACLPAFNAPQKKCAARAGLVVVCLLPHLAFDADYFPGFLLSLAADLALAPRSCGNQPGVHEGNFQTDARPQPAGLFL